MATIRVIWYDKNNKVLVKKILTAAPNEVWLNTFSPAGAVRYEVK